MRRRQILRLLAGAMLLAAVALDPRAARAEEISALYHASYLGLTAGEIRFRFGGSGDDYRDEIAIESTGLAHLVTHFRGSAVAEGSLVIGADGIHSTLQQNVVPPSRPSFSGVVAYRGLVPQERIPRWPTERWLMWLGKGKHFLAFPVRAGKLINFVGFVPADEEMKESWSAPGDPNALRSAFAGWDPRIGSLLQQVRTTFRWGLYDREPLPTWTKGSLTLLGDAAHPMLPHLGQGANQSIEDGMALATILARADQETLPAALLAYERLRRELVAAIQQGARQSGLRYDSAYADLGVRDAEITAHAEFRKRLYDYDVVQDAEAAATALA